MPRGDRTGPWGLGPMTGRGAGFCAGFPVPGYLNPGYWGPRGAWGWWGRGRGWRHRFWATGVPGWAWWGGMPYPPGPVPTPPYWQKPAGSEKQAEKQFLQEQASYLEKQLEELKKRLTELEGEE
ncbi:MAG: DUF5320 domain-containing protein [Clostridia bacterium]|nr:DUF5320 domain-containing protein [Clostridia bacterium]